MQTVFEYLNTCGLAWLFFLFLIENFVVALAAITIGFSFDGLLLNMKQLITKEEIYWSCSTVFFNTLVTLAGYKLFQQGIIVFNLEFSLWEILIDFVVLILTMDFLMYIFHWAIHKLSIIYKYHDLHHRYNTPTAISLFVLHPVEVIGFGSLWLCLLAIGGLSIYATMLYLVFNVAMGIIGHLRKEIIPAVMKEHFIFQWLANTGFHVDHHQHEASNFGFYTKFWDRIFGTLK